MKEESRKKLFTRVHKEMEHFMITGLVVYNIFCCYMVFFARLDYSRLIRKILGTTCVITILN